MDNWTQSALRHNKGIKATCARILDCAIKHIYYYILRLRTHAMSAAAAEAIATALGRKVLPIQGDGRYFQSKEMETVFSVPLATTLMGVR